MRSLVCLWQKTIFWFSLIIYRIIASNTEAIKNRRQQSSQSLGTNYATSVELAVVMTSKHGRNVGPWNVACCQSYSFKAKSQSKATKLTHRILGKCTNVTNKQLCHLQASGCTTLSLNKSPTTHDANRPTVHSLVKKIIGPLHAPRFIDLNISPLCSVCNLTTDMTFHLVWKNYWTTKKLKIYTLYCRPILIHCIRPMHGLGHRLRSILLNIILTVHKPDEVC